MRIKLSLAVLLLTLITASCSGEATIDQKRTIAVSIVPQATFIKAVAGDLVNVVTLIPPGASPANYQPSPKEMAEFSLADVYFTIGVGAEEANILPNVVGQNEGLTIVSLAEKVDAFYPPRFFGEHDDEKHAEEGDDHDHSGRDPHTWMSVNHVMVMIEAIKETLIELDPINEPTYETNAVAYLEKLTKLNEDLASDFSALEDKRFIVMHPSLGYFAEAYGLEMIAIEEDGKEASVSHLQSVIDYAVNHNIHIVFYQQEFDSSQAKTIATEINGQAVPYEPLSGDYIESMYKLGEALSTAFQAQ